MKVLTALLSQLGPSSAFRKSSMPFLLGAFVGWSALQLAFAAPAQAGRYHDYVCRTPSGEPAPADGWSASTSATSYTYAEDTCPRGGALIAAIGDEPMERSANTAVATWALGIPSPETLVGATLWRAGDTAGGGNAAYSYDVWISGPAETSIFDPCSAALGCSSLGDRATPLAAGNRLAVPSEHIGSHMYMKAACGGFSESKCAVGVGDEHGYAAVAYLYAADLVLEQAEGPSASNLGGQLATEPSVSGMSDLVIGATDPGSGIYQALFNVDGNVVQSTLMNENGGHCRSVGQTTDGVPAFLYLQPCLKSVTTGVSFDTTRVSNGTHHLIVSVSDAAGNTATVLDRSILVENKSRGPCNAECDEHAVLHAAKPLLLVRTLTRRYANSGLTLTGQLVDSAGSPMKGAMVELDQEASYLGTRSVPVATTTTGANGRWRLRAPKGPSRLLTVGYRSHADDPVFAAQIQYRESVGAGVRLSAPRHARAGATFTFQGSLPGGYVPREGVLVSLEIYYAGAWREIALLRTGRHGAFAYRYIFAAIGPATYRFRATVPHTIAYPFATASSASRYIHLAG
jgi:hypothetical protein